MKCKISSNARMLLSCGVLIAFALIEERQPMRLVSFW